MYIACFFMYIVTTIALLFSSKDYFGDFALGWMYLIRVIQGFFAIVQPLAFTIISDMSPPNLRALATAMNNLMYLIATLVVTVLNAFVIPEIPGAMPENDDYTIFKSCLYSALFFMAVAFVLSFFMTESCPNVLLMREAKKIGAVYKPIKKDEISYGEAFKFVFGQPHMICLFLAYVFGFGTSTLNQNVNSVQISKYMHMRTSRDSYIMVSI